MHTRKKPAALLILLIVFVCAVPSHGQSDPLAELEAWNKVKESSVAADYHAFLKKFPNGSLAARARERMNELGDPVWNELKKSNDPFKYRDYIKANPDSPFIDQAKARLGVLAPAAIEWEKVKALRDVPSIMRFISANPSGPFAADAKTMIEPELWAAISAGPTDDLLEFYSLHYSSTERGREAASKLQTRKAAKREQDLQGIRTRIAAQNGVKVTRQHTGYPSTEHWYENKVLDACTLETTEFDVNTYNKGLSYVSKSYRIDLSKVISIDPGKPNSWGIQIGVSGGTPPSPNKFSGTSQYFTRKSISRPFTLYSSTPLSEAYVWVLNTYDGNIAARFTADLNALLAICKASK